MLTFLCLLAVNQVWGAFCYLTLLPPSYPQNPTTEFLPTLLLFYFDSLFVWAFALG